MIELSRAGFDLPDVTVEEWLKFGLYGLADGETRDDDLLRPMFAIFTKFLVRFARILIQCSLRPGTQSREALAAALAARCAAIDGDTATIDAFSRDWLGLSQPERWRGAVEMALLGDWVHTLGRGCADDPSILGLLRQHTDAEHRALLPLWERRVRGKRTALLSQSAGTAWTVEDLLVEHRTPESEVLAAELADSRLVVVIRGLAPEEASTARVWASTAQTWDQAALAAGCPAAHGERVRRKLKRLGDRHTARSAAAAQAVDK
ncbi:hypothetical protein [Streptomyces sp. HUAS TT7]|uniref:hypothetical protein n=1 Tax=Streptomyces sp. HUAS TT7 TaxID=3447507 RepID=UPI003F65EE36